MHDAYRTALDNRSHGDCVSNRAESSLNVHSDAEMDDADLTPAMLSLA